MKKRFIAVDYGHVRIGLAVSDPLCCFASPLPYVRGSRDVVWAAREVSQAIQQLCITAHITVEAIIVGLPIHLDGSESERSQEVRLFAEELSRQTSCSIRLWDERMTTCQAQKTLIAADMSRKKRKEAIDGVSGALLLQSFLDSLPQGEAIRP